MKDPEEASDMIADVVLKYRPGENGESREEI
jgi:hypothetical protein